MSESFYERAIMTVRDGLIRAADERCLDLFEVDQTVLCAKDQAQQRLVIGAQYKMSLVLTTSVQESERVSDLRIRKHAFDFGMWLERERELNDVVVFAVARAIIDELDFLIEGWSLRCPTEHYDTLYGIATERQRRVLTDERVPVAV